MTISDTARRRAGFALQAGLAGWAALILALAASGGAHATTVIDAAGDILPTFNPAGAHTTDDFRDLDVVKASVTYDANNFYLTAVMAGAIGSTDTGFYVWGVDTGTAIDFFKAEHDNPQFADAHGDLSPDPLVGVGINFDTFIVLNTDGTGSVNYFSGEPSESVGAVTINGRVISATISRDALEDGATVDVSQFGFNIWPRANGFRNDQIADFAPDGQNFNASAAPEPAAWAMMIAGFGLAGSAMRRRRSLHGA
jgi:hypothetical protein